jgi:hypothetical protein
MTSMQVVQGMAELQSQPGRRGQRKKPVMGSFLQLALSLRTSRLQLVGDVPQTRVFTAGIFFGSCRSGGQFARIVSDGQTWVVGPLP